ncbi:MAG: GNAT family N-acetyltransferase [Tannerellaceae bacterium]|nr:GNAT family N-acetyltransferase [Tannerellaceae bacterium]
MSRLETIQIEKMSGGELDKVAQLLTDAFETNPAYSLVFENKEHVRKGLFWLFRTNLFLLNRGEILTRVIKESGKIIGTFSVLPPGGVKTNALSYLQIGLPGFICRFGFKTLRKMLKMDEFNKGILRQSMPAEEYYYLSMVALREECRGKGIGSYAIRTCLEELSKEAGNCRLMGLTTQLPENVVFYSKLGFVKLDEATLTFQGESYYNCNMTYQFE